MEEEIKKAPVQNADVGAEADNFREAIGAYVTKVTKDDHVNGVTTIEYIVGEGDPPFIKYRLTLEAVATLTPEELEAAEAVE